MVLISRQFLAKFGVPEQVKVSNGRHGDVVDGNERDLRSADVSMSQLDGPVDFNVLLSKIILRGPALLPGRNAFILSRWNSGCG